MSGESVIELSVTFKEISLISDLSIGGYQWTIDQILMLESMKFP